MKKISIALSFATVLMFSCATENANTEVKEEVNTDPTACECQKAIKNEGKNSNIYDICQEKRKDETFSHEFNKCQYADLTGKSVEDVVLPVEKKPELPTPADGDYSLVNENSSIKWTGKKIVGDKHFGSLAVKSGTLSIADGSIASGSIIIDMTSIAVSSIEDAEKNGKLAGHLKDGDFFDVDQYPEATFEINEVVKNDAKYEINGLLTIKDKTEPAKAIMIMAGTGENELVLSGAMTFDRTAYGVNYNSGSVFSDLKDNIIEDNVSLTLSLKAKM